MVDWKVILTGVDRRSTDGYVFLYNEAAVSWCTKKQSITTLYSCEVQHVA